MSIVNARKGLKRATSAESEVKREREKSPVEVKREEITPRKTDVAVKPAVTVKPQSPPSTKSVVQPTKTALQRLPKPVAQLPTNAVERVAVAAVEQIATKSVERPPTKPVDPIATHVEHAPAKPVEQTPNT